MRFSFDALVTVLVQVSWSHHWCHIVAALGYSQLYRGTIQYCQQKRSRIHDIKNDRHGRFQFLCSQTPGNFIINPVPGCRYVPSGPPLPFQPRSITVLWPAPHYTAWQHVHVWVTCSWLPHDSKWAESWICEILIKSQNPMYHVSTPMFILLIHVTTA